VWSGGPALPGIGTAHMLSNHRRTFLYSLCLLLFLVLLFIGVGRHPPGAAPATTFAPIGHLDESTNRAMDHIRNVVLSGVARALNVIGGGYVTIPVRAVISLWLAFRRRWRALGVWVLTWVAAEVLLTAAKAFFHRGRPPDPLVAVDGYSFPSGHAVAAAATAVALVLVLMPSGPRRRKWEAIAVLFAFVMAFSRVYLNAHWLSDVVAGVVLGAGVALGSAALATEVRDVAMRMRGSPVRAGAPPGGMSAPP
jgi:membrane-associated phospholipid phosphatase